jgi:hypothetical protein
MATETRKVTQYKIYKLYLLYVDKDKISHEIPGAIFTEKKTLEKYIKNFDDNAEYTITSLINESWVDLKPEPTNFNLPFNPVFNEDLLQKEVEKHLPHVTIKTPEAKGVQVRVQGKVQVDDELDGLTINKLNG